MLGEIRRELTIAKKKSNFLCVPPVDWLFIIVPKIADDSNEEDGLAEARPGHRMAGRTNTRRVQQTKDKDLTSQLETTTAL